MAFSPETHRTLRRCRFDLDALERGFLRCNVDGDSALARRVVAEIGEDGVCVAHNDCMGGDYVRVNRGTRTWHLIGEMFS